MVGSSPERNNDESGSPSNPPNDLHPEDAAYEVDGWQRGFDVQFNGVGRIVEVRENGDDSSDWESDVSEDGAENCPEGYSALASEPTLLTDPHIALSDETVQQEISDQSAQSSSLSATDMDEQTAKSIRKAVAGLNLPTPTWANNISDNDLVSMITKIQEK